MGLRPPALLEPRSLALFDGRPLKSKVCRLILKLFEAAGDSAREHRHVPGRDLERDGIGLLRVTTLEADSSLPSPLSKKGESELA